MSAHTPGPWTVCAGDARFVALPGIVKPINAGNIGNARVIAGALRMADALRDCIEYLSDIPESAVGGSDEAAQLCRRARAALKEAGL